MAAASLPLLQLCVVHTQTLSSFAAPSTVYFFRNLDNKIMQYTLEHFRLGYIWKEGGVVVVGRQEYIVMFNG